MTAIYKKELRSYFINPIGYVFLGLFLALSAVLCCTTTLMSGTYDTSTYYMYLLFSLSVLIPLLTMRLFAEERKLKTEQLLLTAPVTLTGLVMGKFLAAFTLFGGAALCSCVNMIPLYIVASIERGHQSYDFYHIGPVPGQWIGCLVGLLLIGAAFIAIGALVSSLTENQLAAAVVTIGVLVLLLGLSAFNSSIDWYWLRTVLDWISIYSRFTGFMNGIFDMSSVLYYASVCFVCLFLTVRVYEHRRWS